MTHAIIKIDCGKLPRELDIERFLASVEYDEPIFILRGRDRFAPGAIEFLASCIEEQAHRHANAPEMVQAAELREIAQAMRMWRARR